MAVLARVAAAAPPEQALEAVLRAYLSREHVEGAEIGCAIAALGSEMPRQAPKVRRAATRRIKEMIDLVARHAPDCGQPGAHERALVTVAPFMALYAASKHALEGYSESLDHEVRSSGIRVVLVEPAYTRTSFEGNVYRADQQLGLYQSARSQPEAVMRDAMKVADSPELVASAVVKASAAVSPRRRYTAGRTARQVGLLRRFVPESAFDRSLRRRMRLPA